VIIERNRHDSGLVEFFGGSSHVNLLGWSG